MVKKDWPLKINKKFRNHYNMQSTKIIEELGITEDNYIDWTIAIPSFNLSWERNEGLVTIGFKKDKMRMYFYKFFQSIPKSVQIMLIENDYIAFESDPKNKLLNIYFLPQDLDFEISLQVLLEEAEQEINDGNYFVPDRYSERKVRTKQTVWRNKILENYNFECSIPSCDINEENLLQACHIKDYCKEENKKIGHRANPQNGICFCYLCHRLFDKGYFTLTYDYKIEININKDIKSKIIEDILDGSSGELISNLPNTDKRPLKEYTRSHRKKHQFKID